MKRFLSALLLGCLLFFASASVKAQDTASQTFTLTVAAPLTITTPAAMSSAVVAQPYTLTLAATGGVPPYTWAVTAGSTLPAGMTLSSAGVFAGTPTTAGNYSFNITVTDSKSGTATLKAAVKTAAPAPAPAAKK
jgi:hypothetical protein